MNDAPIPMPMEWEAAELFRQQTGLRLWSSSRTDRMVIDHDLTRDYVCALYGPYWDVVDGKPNRDLRVFVCYRRLEGHVYIQVLTQDEDDDAFLNRDVIPKYNTGLITV